MDGREIWGGPMIQSDEDAILELEHRFNEAWNTHDADGLAESLEDDAQFITSTAPGVRIGQASASE